MNYRKIWSDTFGPIIKGFQVHHIKPKCEGGKDEIGNLIALHPDDHQLIHKMRGDKWSKGGFLSMRNYKPSEDTKLKMSKASMSHLVSKATRNKIGKAHAGKTLTKEHKRLISKSLVGNKRALGLVHTEVTKRKISASSTGINNAMSKSEWQRTCLHCNRTMNKGVYTRWHGANCKLWIGVTYG